MPERKRQEQPDLKQEALNRRSEKADRNNETEAGASRVSEMNIRRYPGCFFVCYKSGILI